MLDKLTHSILPGLVIVGATVLCVAGRIDGTTAVALIGSAGGIGAVAVAKAGPS